MISGKQMSANKYPHSATFGGHFLKIFFLEIQQFPCVSTWQHWSLVENRLIIVLPYGDRHHGHLKQSFTVRNWRQLSLIAVRLNSSDNGLLTKDNILHKEELMILILFHCLCIGVQLSICFLFCIHSNGGKLSISLFYHPCGISEIKILPSAAHSQCALIEYNPCTISWTIAYSDLWRLEKAHLAVLYWLRKRMTLTVLRIKCMFVLASVALATAVFNWHAKHKIPFWSASQNCWQTLKSVKSPLVL